MKTSLATAGTGHHHFLKAVVGVWLADILERRS